MTDPVIMRIVVVGPCASGKSAVAAALESAGYDVTCVAQEHSYIPDLWQRGQPEMLIYLDAGLDTIRRRRRIDWGEAELTEQRARLAHARQRCDFYLKTDGLSLDKVVRRTLRAIATHQRRSPPSASPPTSRSP